jgi:hypothetical protein
MRPHKTKKIKRNKKSVGEREQSFGGTAVERYWQKKKHKKRKKERNVARTVPYSFSYVVRTHSPGSFPRLRTGTKAAPSLEAITGPMRKPRASSPTITSTFLLGEIGMVWDIRRWIRCVIRASKASGLRKSGKISQKATPFKVLSKEQYRRTSTSCSAPRTFLGKSM